MVRVLFKKLILAFLSIIPLSSIMFFSNVVLSKEPSNLVRDAHMALQDINHVKTWTTKEKRTVACKNSSNIKIHRFEKKINGESWVSIDIFYLGKEPLFLLLRGESCKKWETYNKCKSHDKVFQQAVNSWNNRCKLNKQKHRSMFEGKMPSNYFYWDCDNYNVSYVNNLRQSRLSLSPDLVSHNDISRRLKYGVGVSDGEIMQWPPYNSRLEYTDEYLVIYESTLDIDRFIETAKNNPYCEIKKELWKWQ